MNPLAIAGLCIALAGYAAAGVQTWRLDRLQASVDADRLARAEADAESQRIARRDQSRIDDNARRATDVYLARAQSARAAGDRVDDAYRGLLDAIHSAGGTVDDPAAACRAATERVAILEGLLGEGARLAAEGAARVERLDAKLSGLQEHARAGQVRVEP